MTPHALDDLLPHHVQTIANLTRQLEADPAVLGLILGGSIAHGFATPESDVDVTIVVSPEEVARRHAEDRLHYNATDVVTYEGGYVDGKYVDLDGLRLVAERGSDPSRYAYVGARVLFSRVEGLAELVAEITRYPEAERASRIARFTAQLLAWRWYFGQGVAKDDPYLRTQGLAKVVLFACRLVLAQTSTLYPHHKWLMRVTDAVEHKPVDLMPRLRGILAEPTVPAVDALVDDLLAFYGIDRAAADAAWPTHFIRDSEMAWVSGQPAIDEM
jgi:predicted nucleotidyltransferase